MDSFICNACGSHAADSTYAPTHCPICEDDRQYIPRGGQAWTRYKTLNATHHNALRPIRANLHSITIRPKFAIGQRALLLQTPQGNILWDAVPLIDDAMIGVINALGGISAIALSHPHFYSSMAEWSAAFNDAPIYAHEADRQWVQRPSPAIQFWTGQSKSIGDGLTLLNLGGHFPGSSVLHWRDGADGQGALLTGDTVYPVSNRRMVTFMYSYPNVIPLPSQAVAQIRTRLDGYKFAKLYAAWDGSVVTENADQVVRNSAETYIKRQSD